MDVRRVGRWLIALWLPAAAALAAAQTWDAVAPRSWSIFRRLYAYREDHANRPWLMAAAAREELEPGRTVLVDTDHYYFFFALRYQMYPTWVLWDEVDPDAASRDPAAQRVVYRDDELTIP